MGAFIQAATQKDTRTENGALSNSTTGNVLLDYFAQCSSWRGRSELDVFSDLSLIFNEDSLTALRLVFYNRMVTRKTIVSGLDDLEKVQKGQGSKDEFIKSLKFLEMNHPELLYKNLWLVPCVGSYKDLWYDSAATGYYHYVNPEKIYEFLSEQLEYDHEASLIAKYLPRIRSKSNTKTDRHRRMNKWARGFCNYMGISEKQYRKFKSNPKNTAHTWQRQMSRRKWNDIDFNKIPGKALFNLVKGNTLEKHGLEDKYEKWILSKPVAKFTGYVYELYKQAESLIYSSNVKQYKKHTIDKQFDGLLELAEKNVAPEILEKGVFCAIDTSGSMIVPVSDSVRAIDVCVSLGIYFSSLLRGHFKDHVVMFDNNSKIKKLSGGFCDKVLQIRQSSTAWGSTNFQSVIDEIVRVRKSNPRIPVEEYPEVLLVVSDMEFNPTNDYRYTVRLDTTLEQTNYESAMAKLKAVGLPKMQIIWWNVNARNKQFPSTINDNGTTLISGFDPTIITTLLEGQELAKKEGKQLDPVENMNNCLNQELLNLISV